MSALVLVADPDPFHRRVLEEACQAAGYRVITADDAEDVLNTATRQHPDLILMTRGLPGGDGLDVLRLLRKDPSLARIAVLIATDQSDLDGVSPAISAGADECVTRPYRVVEVQQRVRNALRLRDRDAAPGARLGSESDHDVHEIGVGNLEHLNICLSYEMMRATRYRYALSCVVVRVVNYDECLRMLAKNDAEALMTELALGLRHCLRHVDQVFRHADDEFAFVLPETDEAGTHLIVDRILESVHGSSFWKDAPPILPRVAVGAATLSVSGPMLERDLVSEALANLPRDSES